MSRSGYSEDFDGPELHLYRGTVNRSIAGKRGQAFLRKLAAHMDAMPEKKLVAYDWVNQDGSACALGVAMKAETPDLAEKSKGWYQDDDSPVSEVAQALNISEPMAREIVWINDEGDWCRGEAETPEARWTRVRQWVERSIKA